MGASVAPQPPMLQPAVGRAASRVGCAAAHGRYHCLPVRLSDHYVTESEVLGTGINGQVVAGRRRRTGTRVAVKRFALDWMSCKQQRHLINEVEIFLHLDHPHIVRLFDVYESATQVSLVMERLDGGELFDRVSRLGVMAEAEAADAVRQTLSAANYLHSQGIVHRDLKLENFLYERPNGKFLKMIDFGFSRRFGIGERMTTKVGSPTYVAPEVLQKSYFGGTCDLWGIGVVAYILLSGQPPFSGCCDAEILQATISGKYSMTNSRWSAVSPAGRAFVRRLLESAPEQRLTAPEALAHIWLRGLGPAGEVDEVVLDALLQFSRGSRLRRATYRLLARSAALDKAEDEKVRLTFLALDASGACAGVLSRDQLQRQLKGCPGIPVDVVPQVVDALDDDGDGQVRYSDFLAAMMSARLDVHEELLEEALQRAAPEACDCLAQDGTGKLAEADCIHEIEVNCGEEAHTGQAALANLLAHLSDAPEANGNCDGYGGGNGEKLQSPWQVGRERRYPSKTRPSQTPAVHAGEGPTGLLAVLARLACQVCGSAAT